MPWRFSRTHSQTYKTCPKLYWLNYHEAGTGIVPVRMAMGLSRGILAHEMLRDILTGCVIEDKMPSPESVRNIINTKIDEFKQRALERGFEDTEPVSLQMEIDRQACLVEGAVRAWVKTRLPFILQNFRVVQVEKEFEVQLDEDITIMCRLDGVLQRRTDGEYSALEFKTTSTTDEDYFESWRYATQTMWHLLAIERQFGKVGNSVLMEFLQMGMKRHDDVSGIDQYYSPFVRGYRKFGSPPLEPAVEYGWTTDLGRKKAWTILNVWEADFPEKPDWMSNAEYWTEHVLPPETLSNQLVTREVFRNPDELEEMVRNTLAQQRRIYAGVQLMNTIGESDNIDEYRAQFFPGNMDEGCYQNKWRKQCPYLPICYRRIEDALGSGKYQKREPHHEAEFEV